MQEKQVNNPFKDLNGWAMEAGCVLGAYGCASLALFKWSLLYPVAGSLFTFSLAGGPVVAGLLTRRMRDRSRPADAPFLFTEGFLHTLLMGLYASLWVALFIFLYLHYFFNMSIMYMNNLICVLCNTFIVRYHYNRLIIFF